VGREVDVHFVAPHAQEPDSWDLGEVVDVEVVDWVWVDVGCFG
jgi:hypothetical protein